MKSYSIVNLDALVLDVMAARKERDAELRQAFRHPDTLAALIRRDCVQLIAGIAGYTAPLDQEEIHKKMCGDPLFVAQVSATEALVSEYVKAAMRLAPHATETTPASE